MNLLKTSEYNKIKDILPGNETWKGRRWKGNRFSLKDVIYVVKTGCGWEADYIFLSCGKWYFRVAEIQKMVCEWCLG